MLLHPGYVHVFEHDTALRPIGGLSKRMLDLSLASLAVIAFAPLMIITAVLIGISSPGPVFYIHRRIGFNGREFGCIKFRTMKRGSDAILASLLNADPVAAREYAATAKLRRDPRIIPGIGALLRKTSLDEIPQFFNVLKGEMSLVGPRPVTREELDRHYGGHAREVLRARPGISGLWQVSGRSGLSYADRVRLDLDYVRGWCARSDAAILLRTVLVVLRGKGAY